MSCIHPFADLAMALGCTSPREGCLLGKSVQIKESLVSQARATSDQDLSS